MGLVRLVCSYQRLQWILILLMNPLRIQGRYGRVEIIDILLFTSNLYRNIGMSLEIY